VKRHFNPKFFTINKSLDGSPLAGQGLATPSFDVEFRMGNMRKDFGLLCVWQADYEQAQKPRVVWASDEQIEHLQRFAKGRAAPVFVIIGIGGEPGSPADVFVANLNNLKYGSATAEYLAQFRRSRPETDFYYDDKTPALK
jgi:hypothetical protein